MKKTYFILLLLSLFFCKVSAQDFKEEEEQITSLTGKEKVDAIISLLSGDVTYVYTHPEKAREYAGEAIEIAEELNYLEALGPAYASLSVYYEVEGDFINEQETALKALEYFKQTGQEFEFALESVRLGDKFKNQGSLAEALEYYLDAKPIFERLNDPDNQAVVLGSIGMVYRQEGKLKNSLEYQQMALDILLDSTINSENRNYDYIAVTYNNMGQLEVQLGNTAKAYDYFNRALSIDKEFSNDLGVGYDFYAIAALEEQSNAYHSALRHLTSAIERFERVGNLEREIAACFVLEGKISRKLRLFKQSMTQLETALQMAQDNNIKPVVRDAYEELAFLYEEKGDIQKAFDTYQQFIAVKDSITNSEVSENIENLRSSHEVARLQLEIEAKEKEKEIERTKRDQLTAFSLIGGLLLLTLLGVIFSRYQLKQKANDELAQKNKIIASSNEKITGSIRYGRRIQNALLAAGEPIELALPESFVFLKPKDIVSGDFFWYAHIGDIQIIAAIDCTGHGVPGAFMTVFGYSLLNKIVNGDGVTDPSQILNLLGLEVMKLFQTKEEDQIIQDGMDMAVCKIDQKNKQLQFAGANRPLVLHTKEGQQHIKGDKVGLGGKIMLERGKPFQNFVHDYAPGDTFYIFSDGYQDQFGGPEGKKFMSKRFRKYLEEIQPHSMEEQVQMLEDNILEWMNMTNEKQTDDMIVIGVRLE